MTTSERKPDPRIARWRARIGAIAIVVGLVIGTIALVQNFKDNQATAQAQRDSCQQRNRNALQNAANTLVIVDGVLQRFDLPLDGRRAAASASVAALGKETQTGGSIGPRDCNGDDVIDADDYPVGGYPPLPLIDPDTGLPRRPPPAVPGNP